jgi:hypothetical protein
MSYIAVRGLRSDIFVLNVHSPTEDETDDMEISFYDELERILDQFPKYHVEILLGDFNAKLGRENIFNPTIGKEISNDNGIRGVNLAT